MGAHLEGVAAAFAYRRVVEVWYPNLKSGSIRCHEHRPPDSYLCESRPPIVILHDGYQHVHRGIRIDENGKTVSSDETWGGKKPLGIPYESEM